MNENTAVAYGRTPRFGQTTSCARATSFAAERRGGEQIVHCDFFTERVAREREVFAVHQSRRKRSSATGSISGAPRRVAAMRRQKLSCVSIERHGSIFMTERSHAPKSISSCGPSDSIW